MKISLSIKFVLCLIFLNSGMLIRAAAESASAANTQEVAQKKTDAQQKTLQALQGILPPELHANIIDYMAHPLHIIQSHIVLPKDDRQQNMQIATLALTPNGNLLAYAGADQIIRILQRSGDTYRQIYETSKSLWGMIESLAFSSDGKTLVAVSQQAIVVYEYKDGAFVYERKLDFPKKYEGQQNWSPKHNVLFFERDGITYLVSAGWHGVEIWERAANGHFYRIQSLFTQLLEPSFDASAVSSNGQVLILADNNGKIHWYEFESGQFKHKQTEIFKGVDKLAITPNGKYLAAANRDLVKMWELKAGQFELKQEIPAKSARYLKLSNDGSWLCVIQLKVAFEENISIYKKNNQGKFELKQIIPAKEAHIVAFVPDASYIIGHITPLHEGDLFAPAKIYIWRNELIALQRALSGESVSNKN
jgi:WD40 repeat protein